MVKVQIPGSTVTLRPAASGVTLAPKPLTQDGATAVNSVATPTLTAIKMPKVVGAVPTSVKGLFFFLWHKHMVTHDTFFMSHFQKHI